MRAFLGKEGGLSVERTEGRGVPKGDSSRTNLRFGAPGLPPKRPGAVEGHNDPVARRGEILRLLDEGGRVVVSHLSERLSVSEMTVRRDLEALEREDLLRRVHGGAVPSISLSYEPPHAVRVGQNAAAKEQIGRAAADLLREGETVVIDAGTTALEAARALRGRRNLTVITPSLRVAEVLTDEPGVRLMVTGGEVRAGERSLVGDLAVEPFSSLRFDTALLTVGGVDLEAGLTEYNLEDARVKRAAFASSRRRVVCADATKLGKVAFARVAALGELDVLVTDGSAEPEYVEAIRRTGAGVILA